MTAAHECGWFGAFCKAHEGVIDHIDLSNNNLMGSMPSELGEIRGLECLVRFYFKISSVHAIDTLLRKIKY